MASITMPRLSDSMEEGTIVRWLVEDGAEVEVGTELVEIETDKATMPYESDVAGVVHIGAQAGDVLPVGAEIGQVLPAGETPAPAPAPAPVAAAVANGGGTALLERPETATRVKASPVARRLAAELGIDLATLVGSGPAGRVVKRDVEQAVATPEPAPEPQPVAAGGERGDTQVVELSRIQQTIARRMADAKSAMPEFTVTTDVDMDAAVALRAQLKAAAADGDPVPSYNDLVVKAAALALRAHPKANGSYRDGRFELYERINVGVAVAAEDALLVPTVFDADGRSLGAIAAETRRLAAAGREGRLTPADLSGGTFSVSNLGMFGVTQFTAVLNPPQAAILAVGALEQRAVVRDGAVVPGHRMTLTLTCDHRILYGADAAAFLADIRAALEQPLRLAL
ncbi:MAG TPA: dihydrolipoamide acetyltransferase family protein [Capillimicrobium sp.]|nr:dihydrolipoamide acetyltransferase family protein [Capillimicrobium sp.]